jgi:hypothetical protein
MVGQRMVQIRTMLLKSNVQYLTLNSQVPGPKLRATLSSNTSNTQYQTPKKKLDHDPGPYKKPNLDQKESSLEMELKKENTPYIVF